MNNNKNQIFSAEKVIEKKSLKHPERNRVKTVDAMVKVMMQRAYARLHQHDVRAKQTKVCNAERTWFLTPAYASNYLQTDGQTSFTAVSSPSMTLKAEFWH